MTDHPDYARWQDVIRGLKAAPFHGTLYRACTPIYANPQDLLTGQGAQQSGGRWNAPGSCAMVYLAQSIEGALAETLGLAEAYGFDPAARLPLTLVAIDARLERVIDLTDESTRKALGLTLQAMMKCDWRRANREGREALTQALGRAAYMAQWQGLIAPSAVKRTFRNLNVFPEHLGKGDGLAILRSDRLPPSPPPGIL